MCPSLFNFTVHTIIQCLFFRPLLQWLLLRYSPPFQLRLCRVCMAGGAWCSRPIESTTYYSSLLPLSVLNTLIHTILIEVHMSEPRVNHKDKWKDCTQWQASVWNLFVEDEVLSSALNNVRNLFSRSLRQGNHWRWFHLLNYFNIYRIF